MFYHFDWRGDTVALTDASGNVLARLSYSPYGECTVESGQVTTPFRFNGQWGVMTEPNSLFSMEARFYSPVLRRFLNEDPAGMQGGMNLYAFAVGDPANLLDPFGLGPTTAEGGKSWTEIVDGQTVTVTAGIPQEVQDTVAPNSAGDSNGLLEVVLTGADGQTIIPTTAIKDSAQQQFFKLSMNTPLPIATTRAQMGYLFSDVIPFSDRISDLPLPKRLDRFKAFWRLPQNNPKANGHSELDAWGNFEFGVSAEHADFPLWMVEFGAEVNRDGLLHAFVGGNNPINKKDITTGYEAAKKHLNISAQPMP